MTIEEIEKMSYQEMLQHRRFAPVGAPEFIRGTPECEAFDDHFAKLGDEIDTADRVAASKALGWE